MDAGQADRSGYVAGYCRQDYVAFCTGIDRVRDDLDRTVGRFVKNPDRVPLSSIVAESNDLAVTLTLLDLSGTMLTDYRRAEVSQLPFLTVCNSQDKANIDLYLEFDPAALPATTAYAFLKELADRTQVPLRHVL